jgi:uncharacterized membrane protein YdbT with pleckstrin-like domain
MEYKETRQTIELSPSQWFDFPFHLRNAIIIGALLIFLASPDLKNVVLTAINTPIYMFTGYRFSNLDPAVMVLLFFPALNSMYISVYTMTTNYRIEPEFIIHSFGIFNRLEEPLELYRVKDYSLNQNLFMRLIGLYSLKLLTSDIRQPIFYIHGVYKGPSLMALIRNRVERLRTEKGVREFD